MATPTRKVLSVLATALHAPNVAVNLQDAFDETPLALAQHSNRDKSIRYLLEAAGVTEPQDPHQIS
jgi:hypothetical protein